MDTSVPKISFIPKSPLAAREELFLERSRPRSVIGMIAIILFVASIGSYTGLYFYDRSLIAEINKKTKEVKDSQARFSSSKEVSEAKVFRARAELAQELLNAHVVVSPVFEFLSENTVESVYYDKFNFKKDDTKLLVELSGEAQGYASLANQRDVLRKKTTAITDVLVDNVSLSKNGAVTFSLKVAFAPDYLLYLKNLSGDTNIASTSSAQVVASSTIKINREVSTGGLGSKAVAVSLPVPIFSTTTPILATTTVQKNATTTSIAVSTSTPVATPAVTASGWTIVSSTTTQVKATSSTSSASASGSQSMLRSLWQKFKFW